MSCCIVSINLKLTLWKINIILVGYYFNIIQCIADESTPGYIVWDPTLKVEQKHSKSVYYRFVQQQSYFPFSFFRINVISTRTTARALLEKKNLH